MNVTFAVYSKAQGRREAKTRSGKELNNWNELEWGLETKEQIRKSASELSTHRMKVRVCVNVLRNIKVRDK